DYYCCSYTTSGNWVF
nr:immunoglobulin light chain junction region [Macaca mulatta]MOW27551.1 immunoglobulin light chain junction region [Macaca mulatta]MOW28253.1 immunoglobulin light chain junction region [Macaca mulatta]MOW28309.1 immunoglobulin light chain junction region [Macaca mulatta]MOW29135.1 immunoglobulin light chain junction region [Macaca mulatta]